MVLVLTEWKNDMEDPLTPPPSAGEMPTKRRKIVSEEDDMDDDTIDRILKSYAPLSNLPTPPLSNESSPRPSSADGALREPGAHVMGAARFLARAVRVREKGVPALRPSKVEDIVIRSGLDSHRIAFAACIIYRLSWRFVREWKKELLSRQREADLRSPEVIVMAALHMASSWLDECPRSTRFWVTEVAGFISKDAFAGTQKCMLNDPEMSLFNIDAQDVEDMRDEMGFRRDSIADRLV